VNISQLNLKSEKFDDDDDDNNNNNNNTSAICTLFQEVGKGSVDSPFCPLKRSTDINLFSLAFVLWVI
jgi:hypothetical protein